MTLHPGAAVLPDGDAGAAGKAEEQREHRGSQTLDAFELPLEALQEGGTCAGLHFMAAVRRKAVACQDASTNTDPDKEAASHVVSECWKNQQAISSTPEWEPLAAPPPSAPGVSLSLRLPSERAEQPLPPSALDAVGHTYLHVIDIEAGDLQGLPVGEPSDEDVLRRQAGGPSSAACQLMAASLGGAAPPRGAESQGPASSAGHLPLTPAEVSPSCEERGSWGAAAQAEEPGVPSPPSSVGGDGGASAVGPPAVMAAARPGRRAALKAVGSRGPLPGDLPTPLRCEGSPGKGKLFHEVCRPCGLRGCPFLWLYFLSFFFFFKNIFY